VPVAIGLDEVEDDTTETKVVAGLGAFEVVAGLGDFDKVAGSGLYTDEAGLVVTAERVVSAGG